MLTVFATVESFDPADLDDPSTTTLQQQLIGYSQEDADEAAAEYREELEERGYHVESVWAVEV
jgi:hypothetical protein